MVGMQVSQKQGYIVKRNFELIKTLSRAAAAIEQQLFSSSLYQDAGTKALHHRARRARAQQSDLKILRERGRGQADDHDPEPDGLQPPASARAWDEIHKFMREMTRPGWERPSPIPCIE